MIESRSPIVPADRDLETLLEYLKYERGFDLTGYKRAGLGRRIRKRMGELRVADLDAYRDYLGERPEECDRLYATVLINVTDFFREPASWRALAETILPRIIGGKAPGETIRVWSAGCSTGQEVYSLLLLMGEALGMERLLAQVKIYATDVDEEALAAARQGSYGEKEMESVPDSLKDRYFVTLGNRFIVRPELRRAVAFERHDLTRDAPVAELDLLVCRNTLMYFTAEAQSRILPRLHTALRDDGFLFLGRAEMLLTRNHLFVPVDLRSRIFTKARHAVRFEQPPCGGSGGT